VHSSPWTYKMHTFALVPALAHDHAAIAAANNASQDGNVRLAELTWFVALTDATAPCMALRAGPA
jgi:hypothetical protein